MQTMKPKPSSDGKIFLKALLATPPLIPEGHVHLLKRLLASSRYSSHARQALKSRDLRALLCLMAIVVPQDYSEEEQHEGAVKCSGYRNELSYAIEELKELVHVRFLDGQEEKQAEAGTVHELLAVEGALIIKLEEMERKLADMKHKSDSLSQGRTEEMKSLEKKLQEQEKENEGSVLSEVEGLEIEHVVSGKKFQFKLGVIDWEEREANLRLETTLCTLNEGYKGLRGHRAELETELRGVVAEYDAGVSRLQEELDALSLEERSGLLGLFDLEGLARQVDERWDEMRATKRLRELLKNLERAESVKKNWAARRIQEAWKRYKIMKLRKKKIKGKRGKGKAGKGSKP